MSAHEIMIYKSKWEGRTVQFTDAAEDLECYAEIGMKAVLLEARQDHPEVWVLFLDYAPFDAHNLPLEQSNYYDKNHNPCLTAREAGFYKARDTIYLSDPSSWDHYLTVVAS